MTDAATGMLFVTAAILAGLAVLYVWNQAPGRPPVPVVPGARTEVTILKGRRAWLRLEPDEPSRTRLEITLRDPPPGTFHLHPERPEDARLRARLPDALPLQLGAGRYLLRASPAGFAARLFAVERRAELAVRLSELAAFGPLRVDLLRHGLVVEWEPLIERYDDRRRILQIAGSLLDLIDGLGVGIVFVSEAIAPIGVCEVCGTGMSQDLVRCRRCRTPHHRECWSYVGRCTTFGCLETQAEGPRAAVAAPRIAVPAPKPDVLSIPWAEDPEIRAVLAEIQALCRRRTR